MLCGEVERPPRWASSRRAQRPSEPRQHLPDILNGAQRRQIDPEMLRGFVRVRGVRAVHLLRIVAVIAAQHHASWNRTWRQAGPPLTRAPERKGPQSEARPPFPLPLADTGRGGNIRPLVEGIAERRFGSRLNQPTSLGFDDLLLSQAPRVSDRARVPRRQKRSHCCAAAAGDEPCRRSCGRLGFLAHHSSVLRPRAVILQDQKGAARKPSPKTPVSDRSSSLLDDRWRCLRPFMIDAFW